MAYDDYNLKGLLGQGSAPLDPGTPGLPGGDNYPDDGGGYMYPGGDDFTISGGPEKAAARQRQAYLDNQRSTGDKAQKAMYAGNQQAQGGKAAAALAAAYKADQLKKYRAAGLAAGNDMSWMDQPGAIVGPPDPNAVQMPNTPPGGSPWWAAGPPDPNLPVTPLPEVPSGWAPPAGDVAPPPAMSPLPPIPVGGDAAQREAWIQNRAKQHFEANRQQTAGAAAGQGAVAPMDPYAAWRRKQDDDYDRYRKYLAAQGSQYPGNV